MENLDLSMPTTPEHVLVRVIKPLVDNGGSNQKCDSEKILISTEGSPLSYVQVRKRELQSWEINSQIPHPLQKSLPQYVNPVSLCLNISTDRKFVLFFLEHLLFQQSHSTQVGSS